MREGLKHSRYILLRERALRNENVVEGNYAEGTLEVSARKLLKEVYNEDISENNTK